MKKITAIDIELLCAKLKPSAEALQLCLKIYGGSNKEKDAIQFAWGACSVFWYQQMKEAGCVDGAAIIKGSVDNAASFGILVTDLTETAE